MKKFSEIDIAKLPMIKKRVGKKWVDNTAIAFDIETTSAVVDGMESGYMYIWQMEVEGVCFYGRTWDEFFTVLREMHAARKEQFIVYVHNLAWEAQWLLPMLDDPKVFARKARHPIKITADEYGVEFRCSYMLTQCSLAQVPHEYGTKTQKLSGDLDYTLTRNSLTPLTDEELAYCENDVRVVVEVIQKFREEYGTIKNIPLTGTGVLRRECRDLYHGNAEYHRWLTGQLETDIRMFKILMKCFAGGYTHANAHQAGYVVNDITSYDISSSYPAVMVTEKFPITKFSEVRPDLGSIDTDHCYIMCIRIKGAEAKLCNTYISSSHCEKLVGAMLDNGRVSYAEEIVMWCTNIDLEIIRWDYDYDSMECITMYRADAGYLDKAYVSKILSMYAGKTTLKGVDGQEFEYMRLKRKINSAYGMMVTATIADESDYCHGWTTHELTDEEAQEKLDKFVSAKGTFLNPAWGVFVTAYARHNLWEMIRAIDADVIYCDTDSVKYKGRHDDVFAEYNARMDEKLKKASVSQGFDLDLCYPKTSKGKCKPLGHYDYDGHYAEFVTLGAKKYAYKNDDGSVHITVSGVSKGAACALRGDLHNFRPGMVFSRASILEAGGDDSAVKRVVFYNDEQKPAVITDYMGNSETMTDPAGAMIAETEYTLGVTNEYAETVRTYNTLSSIKKDIII